MKIGHWQLECITGDVSTNADTVVERLAQADDDRIDIVSFPESFLTGYYSDEVRARENSLELGGPEIQDLLCRTKHLEPCFMVGFNERRGTDLLNTVIIARKGELMGTYSKAFPCFPYFTPGKEFPIFEHAGLTFGVVICADGGYIEPARILALKGARLIFAPHYNYISGDGLLSHFQRVRGDHIARARENDVWFFRGNNVCSGRDAGLNRDGVGYGDSYLLDPHGEIVARGQRHVECLITATVTVDEKANYRRRSLASARALLGELQEAVSRLDQ